MIYLRMYLERYQSCYDVKRWQYSLNDLRQVLEYLTGKETWIDFSIKQRGINVYACIKVDEIYEEYRFKIT